MQKITVKNIHKSLNNNGYICDTPFAASITSAMHSKPVSGAFLYGPAGTGKSYLPIVLSKTLGVEMFFYQCAPGTREDDLVLKMLPSEDTKSGVEIKKSTVFKAAEASHKNKVMLVLDEWDKTRPTADGFFLDFLQYGRLSIPGNEIKANLDNMFIFFTANDEREFHEALLRRFPKIDVSPLEPSLVMTALRLTHNNHPHLSNVVKLYEKAVMSGMSKPATIQEIRQLLDAITLLGKGADWNDLVYQFITKTPENHKLLKDAENLEYESSKKSDLQINADNYNGKIKKKDDETRKNMMPTGISYLIESESIKSHDKSLSDDEIYGIYDYTDENYSMLAHKDMQLNISNDNSNEINEFIVKHDKLLRDKPLQLTNISYNQYDIAQESEGELALFDENCKLRDLTRIPFWREFIIRKYSRNEVIARYKYEYQEDDNKLITLHIDLRWVKNEGVTIICGYSKYGAITHFFSKGSNSGQFINVSYFNEDVTPLILFCQKFDNGKYNGMLNLRNLVNHNHIQYGFKTSRNKLDGYAWFHEMINGSLSMENNSINNCTYYGKNYKIEINETDIASTIFINIHIYGAIPSNVMKGLIRTQYECAAAPIDREYLAHIPVYKAVKSNGKKLSTHLKKYGWKFSNHRRGMMRKSYKILGWCYAFVYDDFVIFGFQATEDWRSHNFGKAYGIVKQLARSAECRK